MIKWEYMDLCPDSDAGYSVMLREAGEEGWEAVCSWVELHGFHKTPINHILYKRPAHVHEFKGDPVGTCECGLMVVPPGWEVIESQPKL